MANPKAGRSTRTWILYAALTAGALAVSVVFGPEGPRTVPYDEAVDLVLGDRVESAIVRSDEIMLRLRPEREGGEGAKVRAVRLPGVEQEPLVAALMNKEIRVDAKSPMGTPWLQALWWIVPLLVINLVFFVGLRRLGGLERGPLPFLKSRTRLYDRNRAGRVRFDDVAGVDEAKAELVEVIDFLRQPERYRSLGGRIPRGLLLIGPPGTGKTLLARACAGEASVPFFTLNASEFVEMYAGLGAARVRELFEQARKASPSIVFIDEIDAVGRARGAQNQLAAHDEREQTLHQLLAELDGFDKSTTVILMAATNRPEVLDPALLRPGRFDRQVIVDRPDQAGRASILAVHARKLPLASDVDLEAVARRTPGMVGADLANLVNEAALAGARRSAKAIAQADFEEALDRVQLGLRRRGQLMTIGERRRVAYHEAGHALVALSLPSADPVERVSIVARTMGALGSTLMVPRAERRLVTERELETTVTVMLGGRAAEELALGEVSSGAHDDLGRATGIVRDMVTRFGMSKKLGLPTLVTKVGAPLLGMTQEERTCSEETAREIDKEVRDRLAELYARARLVLARQRPGLEAAAEALLERETLTGEELRKIAGRARLRRPTSSAA